jgi:hypothetical protein
MPFEPLIIVARMIEAPRIIGGKLVDLARCFGDSSTHYHYIGCAVNGRVKTGEIIGSEKD